MPNPQTIKLITALLNLFVPRPFITRLPGGILIPPADSAPLFTLVLNRPGALRRMFLPPSELAMAEGFIYQDFDIEGDMVVAFAFFEKMPWPALPAMQWLKLAWGLVQLERLEKGEQTEHSRLSAFKGYEEYGRFHSHARDRRAIQYHYDLSNDFYKLWMDSTMTYSCAYFAHPGEDLETAQQRKLDLICQKLQLKPGETLLDVGCGWGGLLIHAAKQYGVNGVGISISEAQTAEARARIQAHGLADRCRIEICHYEAYQSLPFDKLVSVGMFEHLGPGKLPTYFGKLFGLLKPGGLFLLQGASSLAGYPHLDRSWQDWLGIGRNAFYQKYSFPDSQMVDIGTITDRAERAGFHTRTVENLREHYALTIRHWLRRLEANRQTAVSDVGEVAYRCWQLLFAFSAYFMERGILAEYQTLFMRPRENGRA